MIDMNKLRKLLHDDEERKSYLYDDKTGQKFIGQKVLGKLTIGVGYNIQDNGINDEMIDLMLETSIKESLAVCQEFFQNWRGISSDRQIALVSMAFNLGRNKFREFKNLISAVNHEDWQSAAAEILDSKAARDLPKRYARLAAMIKQDHDV